MTGQSRGADISPRHGLTTHGVKQNWVTKGQVGWYMYIYIYYNGVVTSREILVQAVKRWSSHRYHAGTSLDAPRSFYTRRRRAPTKCLFVNS